MHCLRAKISKLIRNE